MIKSHTLSELRILLNSFKSWSSLKNGWIMNCLILIILCASILRVGDLIVIWINTIYFLGSYLNTFKQNFAKMIKSLGIFQKIWEPSEVNNGQKNLWKFTKVLFKIIINNFPFLIILAFITQTSQSSFNILLDCIPIQQELCICRVENLISLIASFHQFLIHLKMLLEKCQMLGN